MSNQPEPTPPREWKDDVVGEICTDDYAINGCGCGCVPRDIEVKVSHLNQDARTTLLRGQAERDYTPEQILLEKLQELKVELAFQHGNSLHECKACSLLREITGDDGTMEGISGKLISIASADKAEAEREKK